MTLSYGIDTSILVRLTTGLPQHEFEEALSALKPMVEREGVQLVASNMVIGEAYMAIQHHYGLSKADVRAGLLSVLTSGLVRPAHGDGVLTVISQASKGCGLMDRLIAHDYAHSQHDVITLDQKMAKLPGVKNLRPQNA